MSAPLRIPLLALALSCGCERAPAQPPLSILLVTLDTTRADALGCYGGRRAATPALDALARESLLFERAHTVAPITLPAHASILTGLYPPRHAVRENGLWPLSGSADTLAERCAAAGLQTAAVVASSVLDRTFGLAQGFETYRGSALEQRTTVYASLPARVVVDEALAWLRARDRARPFFLWVHLYDPHAPYDPPAAFVRGRSGLELYFGEVESMDRELGRLLEALRVEGVLGSTVVAVVADHGEALGEHGEITHGAYAWQTTLHVPLLLRYPDGARAGEREHGLVGVADLFPTLLEAIGATPPEGLDGASLWRRAPPAGRGLYFESEMGWLAFGWSQLVGWMDERCKYLHSAEPQLFDLARDPAERHDLLEGDARGAPDVEPFRRAIAEVFRRPALPVEPTAALDPALEASLRALGYAAAPHAGTALPDPLAPTDRPSPTSRVDEFHALLNATGLVDTGHLDEGIAVLERALAEGPASAFVLEQLSSALLRRDRAAEALPLLERLTRDFPPRSVDFQNLASAHAALGRDEEAVAVLQRAIALDPRNGAALRGMARLLERMGRADEAAGWRERADALGP